MGRGHKVDRGWGVIARLGPRFFSFTRILLNQRLLFLTPAV